MECRFAFLLHQLQIHADGFCLLLHILLGDVGVDVHCGGEISMSHDLLNKFNIIGALTKPGAEGVPKVVHTEMREQIRLTVFQLSLIHFLHVVGNADSLNRPVDVMGTKEGAGAVAKNETVKSVQCQFIIWVESLHSFDLKAKLFSYFRIEDRNGSGTALGFGSSDVKTGFSVNDPVDKIVVDENCILFKVDVAFRNAGALCHAHPRSKQHSHDWKPMAVGTTNQEYREYIEMWIHEVKTPITSAHLIVENDKNMTTLRIDKELHSWPHPARCSAPFGLFERE